MRRRAIAIVGVLLVLVVGAVAWWVVARQLGQVPTQHWSVSIYDRLVVPSLRRIEAGRSPRFGQSLFCVGTVKE